MHSRLSRSFRKREPISISTSIKDSDLLEIKHYPDYSILFFVVVILLGYSVLVFLFVQLPLLYFLLPFILLLSHFLFNNRPITCIVDKQLGQIDYVREGILGFTFGQQKIRCNVSEIKQLKIKRYSSRFGDTFKISLVLNNGQRLPLSSNKLGRSDCRRFANRLSKFLEREIPFISGID